MHTDDEQDYDHDNLYVYTIDFLCSFIDNRCAQFPVLQTNPPANLVLTDGFNPVEILSVSYAGSNLTVAFRVVTQAQQIKFTLNPGGTVYSAGTQQTGNHTFTQTVTLSSGNYSLTATAVTDGFTGGAFDFAV
jgi:hypothetical protein